MNSLEKYATIIFITLALFLTLLTFTIFVSNARAQDISPKSTTTTNLAHSGASQAQLNWMFQLSKCESGDRPDITVLDSNNRYSYGLFQFQFSTFMNFGKQYGILPQSLSDSEGLLLIHNPFIQRGIAEAMLDDRLSYHWLNCRNKIGVPYPINGD